MTPVFYGIDDSALPMHPLKLLGHILIEMDAFKEGVKQPTKKKTRLMIKDVWVERFFTEIVQNCSSPLTRAQAKKTYLISKYILITLVIGEINPTSQELQHFGPYVMNNHDKRVRTEKIEVHRSVDKSNCMFKNKNVMSGGHNIFREVGRHLCTDRW